MTNIVSIVVPVYNPEISLLERAVQSVLKQNYINYELLLINDGSTDSQVLSYLEKQSTVEGIRVLHQKENRGVAEARNRGIREAIGDWVAFLDQDDYYCPDFLSGMMQGVENSDTDMRMAGFYLVRGEQRKPFPAASGSFASPWLIWSTCAIWSRIYRRRALLENAVGQVQVDPKTEHIAQDSPRNEDFCQISGFTFRYDASAPAGERVVSVRLDDGTELEREDGTSRISVTGPISLLGAFDPQELDKTCADALWDYVSAHTELPEGEQGRITVLGARENMIVGMFPRWLLVVGIAVLAALLAGSGLRLKHHKEEFD